MRVQGRDEEIDKDTYARLIGDGVAEQIRRTLDSSSRNVLIDPGQVVAAVSPLVVWETSDRPNALAALLGPFWTTARVRQALGNPTRQALDSRRRNGSLLGLRTPEGVIYYPVAQFHRRNGTVEVRPTLIHLFRALKEHDPWTVGVLMHTPADELDSLTPLEWARQDRDHETLAHYAAVVAREWAAGAA
jgi:hypothetical protein